MTVGMSSVSKGGSAAVGLLQGANPNELCGRVYNYEGIMKNGLYLGKSAVPYYVLGNVYLIADSTATRGWGIKRFRVGQCLKLGR
jgi:hypothetical protein